jgi:ribosomal protein S27AE
MSCRKSWSREILVNNFTLKFVGRDYKSRRESLLLEREKSLMPATQPYVELERKVRKTTQEIAGRASVIKEETDKLNSISGRQLGPLAVEHGFYNEFDANVLRHKLITDQRKVISNLALDVQHLEWYQNQLINRIHGGQVEQEKRQFVRACPASDCRGFLSTAWKCGMCDNWTCPECHEVKGKDKDGPHTCDPNSVETAKLLARDSRNCPKCAAMIFKIDGCDQMYCTQCHTAFSWRTGRIETGTIHNPHYYEYHRQRGTLQRNPGDVPCGGFPDWHMVTRLCPRTHIFFPRIAAAHRTHAHCQWVVMPRYIVGNQDNRDLRIKFMIGDINEDEFKKKIQQREKARQRKGEIHQVLEMFTTVLNDLFQAYVSNSRSSELVESLDELRNHFNTTMRSVSRRYSQCAVPTLTENFDMY